MLHAKVMHSPSRLACMRCRKHHLKCDADNPSCSRCLKAQISCVYLPSRRGAKRKLSRLDQDGSPEQMTEQPRPPFEFEASNSVNRPANVGTNVDVLEQDVSSSALGESPFFDNRLVRLYYENFHPAHPILVPASLYEGRHYPQYLHQVVKFIGSQFSMLIPSDSLSDSTSGHLKDNTEKTTCTVQALLLYAIIMVGRQEVSQAQRSVAEAIDIALELGMYRKDFATTFSTTLELESESVRRTWWELFIFEIHLASLHSGLSLRCGDVAQDVSLPCEEALYVSPGRIPPPSSLQSLSRRVFLEDEDVYSGYSSFSYRIDAARILARVLVLNGLPAMHQDHLQAVINALISWVNHLPPNKVDIVDMYGNVDEMLFQAHIIIYSAAMLLHLPRSNLQLKLVEMKSRICPAIPFRLSPSLTRHIHDIQAIEASKRLSNLLSARFHAKCYSPCTIPALVLCGITQLCAADIHPSECSDHHYNRVVLVLGCLRSLRDNLRLASEAYYYLKKAGAQSVNSGDSSSRVQEASNARSETGHRYSRDQTADEVVGVPHYMSGVVSPMRLSSYVDPTCRDPLLAQMSFFEFSPARLDT